MEDQGGIPLSKGETLRMFGDGGIFKEYIVMDKIIDCRALDKDWIVDITYTLRRL